VCVRVYVCVCVCVCLCACTCGVDVKVGGAVGDRAHGVEAGPFGRDLGGVAQRLVHRHLERTFGDRLAGEHHRHLGNHNQYHPETPQT